MHRKGFTLVELAVGTVLIGVGLAAIVNVLQYATRLTNTTKSQVVAINLAREGVETIFNIRDTNWRMFASKKDQCWLSITPIASGANCETYPWMNADTRYYTIKSPLRNILYYTGEMMLTALPGQPLNVLENKGNDALGGSGYRMCYFSGTGSTSGYWDTCNGSSNGVFASKYGRYRRGIEIKGLFRKDNIAGGTPLVGCTAGSICGDSTAKELRFCSRVDYEFGITRRIELCSAITNFEE